MWSGGKRHSLYKSIKYQVFMATVIEDEGSQHIFNLKLWVNNGTGERTWSLNFMIIREGSSSVGLFNSTTSPSSLSLDGVASTNKVLGEHAFKAMQSSDE